MREGRGGGGSFGLMKRSWVVGGIICREGNVREGVVVVVVRVRVGVRVEVR